jgi:hypothetical protein
MKKIIAVTCLVLILTLYNHFSISGSTYSVILIQEETETRIVNWLTKDKADEIAGELKRIWY